MNVFTDYHHGNLYYSLHLLFEKRLGFKLFRPIGLEWFTNGWWKVAEPYGNAQDTINQYLAINNDGYIPYRNLNGDNWVEDDIYHVNDPENSFYHKAITLEKFKEMKIDLIVASFPTHHNWVDLLRYHPNAKFIMQIGNEGQSSDAKNILCSTADFQPRDDQHLVRYHQEINLDDCYYEPPKNHNTVKSFVVSMPEPELFEAYKNALPEFDFKGYGVGSPDGTVSGDTIPQLMRDSAFGYHVKPADGYGVVIHKWALSGRPLITRASYYKGKMAEPLLEDGITCIDLDQHTFEENVELVKKASEPKAHLAMCKAMANRAREVIDFDREAKEIKKFIEGII